MPWSAIAAALSKATGQPFVATRRIRAGGGCINTTETLIGADGRQYFVKLNAPDRLAMFTAEAAGLDEIAQSRTLRVPRPICHGTTNGHAYLVLEHMNLGGHGDETRLARDLAALHRTTQPQFGWFRDNTIGSTPQPNTPSDSWATFWRSQRLGFQLALAEREGAPMALLDKGERVLADLPMFFRDYHPSPALLHGDLWSGNHGFWNDIPVVFDPAVYFGDREADLAMTELFGGFSSAFYAAYREAWPLDPGYSVRKTLYNLYHVLNHFVMFGGSYANQADRMCTQLLAELK